MFFFGPLTNCNFQYQRYTQKKSQSRPITQLFFLANQRGDLALKKTGFIISNVDHIYRRLFLSRNTQCNGGWVHSSFLSKHGQNRLWISISLITNNVLKSVHNVITEIVTIMGLLFRSDHTWKKDVIFLLVPDFYVH